MPRSSLQDAHRRLRVSINSANINYQVIKLHVRLNEQWGYTQLPTSQDSVPVLPAPRGRIRLTQASIILPTTNPVSL